VEAGRARRAGWVQDVHLAEGWGLLGADHGGASACSDADDLPGKSIMSTFYKDKESTRNSGTSCDDV